AATSLVATRWVTQKTTGSASPVSPANRIRSSVAKKCVERRLRLAVTIECPRPLSIRHGALSAYGLPFLRATAPFLCRLIPRPALAGRGRPLWASHSVSSRFATGAGHGAERREA